MNPYGPLKVIQNVDDELITKAANVEKRKKKVWLPYIGIAVCFTVCVLTVWGMNQNQVIEMDNKTVTYAACYDSTIEQNQEDITFVKAVTQETENQAATTVTQQDLETTVMQTTTAVTQAGAFENSYSVWEETSTTVQERATEYGGDEQSGYFCIPAPPDHAANEKLDVTGEKITDEEANAYWEENRVSIVSGLSASGVPTDDIQMKEKGYSHVCYDGKIGKNLELRQNFRDYLVYNGENLVAILTFYKLDGKLYQCPAFGAPWFSDYSEWLNAHREQNLLYVYAGTLELVIAPDNTYCNPLGMDVRQYLDGLENPYEFFYSAAAVYRP